MQRVKNLLLCTLAALLFCGGARAEKQIVLTFVGDCTVGCEETMRYSDESFVAYAQREGYGYFLAKMKAFFEQDDLTVGNFEGVLKDTPYGAVNKRYCFRGQPDYTQILALGSVEAVNLANNHSGDYGNKGRQTTLEALNAAGIASFGNGSYYLYEKDGIKIAFCGFWGVGFNKRADMAAQVRALKAAGANAVICALHFGEEYATYHSNVQAKVAHAMIDAGADLVVGHHPHVVQGMEEYQSRSIFYSIGNFLFGGNAAVRANESLVPRVTLRFTDDGQYIGQQVTLYPANISGDPERNDYQPRLVTGDAANAVYARLDKDSAALETNYTQTDECRTYPFLAAEPSAEAAR